MAIAPLGLNGCKQRSCVIAPVQAPSDNVAATNTIAVKNQIVKENNVAPVSWYSSSRLVSAHTFMGTYPTDATRE